MHVEYLLPGNVSLITLLSTDKCPQF